MSSFSIHAKKKDSDTCIPVPKQQTTAENNKNLPSPCLHCHSLKGGIQVSCDECAAHICNSCHWCHEFQANHEIRVCDRCDGFYCKDCDEMDQCEDCGEVVCGGCSSLLSCKFCGGGLCPDCATACGKCGIVLCARDSKFAVECDTCKLSYCLVCLASSNKDPCVRCGHRPSKRMEQLVHLRLKSIYKAFQQSNPKSSNNKNRDSASSRAVAAAAAAACGASKMDQDDDEKKKSSSTDKSNEKTFSARQAEADLAAAALLAELDEEEQVQKKKSSKKKKKKGKKKQQQQLQQEEMEVTATTSSSMDSKQPAAKNEVVLVEESPSTTTKSAMENVEDPPTPPAEEEEEEKMDPDEIKLYEMVADGNGEGIEALLAEMRGVPGKAALRKNAKKALKRLKEEDERLKEKEEAEHKAAQEAAVAMAASIAASNIHNKDPSSSSGSYKPPEPLLTLVSRNVHSNSKSECVLHMSPQVVGWVIGKGGQRIRDLMEDSGSKVWIDQDSMGTNEARIVYVSGPGKAVDDAVRRIKDLVAKAPVGASTTAAGVTTAAAVSSSGASHSTKSTTKMTPSSPDIQPKEAPSHVPPSKPSPSRGRSKSISQHDKDWAIHEINCEARFVPLLIGRRGWTIKHIQDSSGARVDIDQTVTPRKIKISGKKDCVATAIRMVKDVLSYPHAQLDKSGTAAAAAAASARRNGATNTTPVLAPTAPDADELASIEAERNQSNHSPPPSSLIMTGDAKGTISASSSLSSTPEPSMASASKSSSYKHPLSSSGDVIAPNYGGGGPPYLQASLQGDVIPQQQSREPPIAMATGAAAIGGAGLTAGAGLQQDALFMNNPPPQGGPAFSPVPPQSGGMPFQQQGQQGLQQRASSVPLSNIGAPAGFVQSQQGIGGAGLYRQQHQQLSPPPIRGQSLLGDAPMGGSTQPQGVMNQAPIGQAAPPLMQQQGRPMPSFPNADSYQPARMLFQKQQQDQMPSGNVNDTESFDLFGRTRGGIGGISASEHNATVDHSSSYLFQGGPAPPHRQNSDSQLPPHLYADQQQSRLASIPRRNSTGMSSSSFLQQQHQAPGMPADSDIVDSLFGPAGGGNQPSLLSGIQGLNLSSNSNAAPGWGSSIAGWGNNNDTNNNNAGGNAASQPLNHALNSGGMLNGQQQSQQQQPGQQQSRFNWG